MRYSIIVPVYNAEKYLRDCLDSVLAQTCGDWECLSIDDGSNDESALILNEYAAKDSRFRYLQQKHTGVGSARNIGMDSAHGDYLVFLDADDTLLPTALERLNGETADIVSFLPMKKGSMFDSLAGNMIAWNAIYRREAVKGVRFPNFVNCEDLVFAAEAFARAETIKAGAPVWYCHNDVANSSYNSHSWRRVKDSWQSIWLMREAYQTMLRGVGMRLVLARKLCLHFLLHVVAEVPMALINFKRR